MRSVLGDGVCLDRVVAVVASFDGGGEQVASGYLIGAGRVVTAEHATRYSGPGTPRAVTGLEVVQVATGARAAVDVMDRGAVVVDPVLDVAVVDVPKAREWHMADGAPVGVWGVQRTPGVLADCVVIGVPRFAYDPGRNLYGHAEVRGEIRRTDGAETGHLIMRDPVLHSVHDPLEVSGSGWGGLSGALVFYQGRALGVVVEHHPAQGDNSVHLIGFDKITANPDLAKAWGQSGPLPLAPASPGRLLGAYRATIEQMLRALAGRLGQQPGQGLSGREQELAAVAEFATGPVGYRWLVGGPFCGKTALMLHAVTGALPDSVDVVSYFMRQVSSDANRDGFLTAVVPQLAELCEVAVDSRDEHTFRRLWQLAAERAEREGRYLLLVVDGLDEDLHPQRSVAAVLPDLVAGRGADRAHVHVTGRRNPELPADVAGVAGHPLAAITADMRDKLDGFPGWEAERDLGKAEIDALVGAGGMAADLMGLLAAAAGPLTVHDLADLHARGAGVRREGLAAVRGVLSGARSLDWFGSLDQPRYQFAHATLLEHARHHQDLADPRNPVRPDPDFRGRIDTWADGWAAAGWPRPGAGKPGTPRYLLDTYPAILADDPQRRAALAGDVGWVDAATRMIGVNPTLGALHAAAAGGDPRAEAMAATVSAQQAALQDRPAVPDPARPLRQLALQALIYGQADLAAAARDRQRDLPAPGPVPLWTTMHQSPFALELGCHGDWVSAVAVAPDGSVVTSGDDGRVLVWHRDRPGQPEELGCHGDWVSAVALAPGGAVVTGGHDGRVLVWHRDRPGQPEELGRHGDGVSAVAVAPDGAVVTGGHDGRVLVWHRDRPGQPEELGGHGDGVWAVAVAPDGAVVTSGDDGRVLVWYGVWRGQLADGWALVWDRRRPRQPEELGGHGDGVRAVAVAPDGAVVTGGDDGRVVVWHPDRPGQPEELGGHGDGVSAVAVAPGGSVVTGGVDGRVLVWHRDRPGQPEELGRHGDWVRAVAVAPDGSVVTGGVDGRVLVWYRGRPGQPEELGRHGDWVSAVALAPDGAVVTGGHDRRVLVWDRRRPGQPQELGYHDSVVRAVAVAPDGAVVTGGDDRRVLVWDRHRPGQPEELGRHGDWVRAVAVAPDGAVVTGGDDRRVLMWNRNTPGRPVYDIPHPGAITVIALSRGLVVAAAVDTGGGITCWDLPHLSGPGPEPLS